MLETLIALGRVNKRGNKMEVQVAGNSETCLEVLASSARTVMSLWVPILVGS